MEADGGPNAGVSFSVAKVKQRRISPGYVVHVQDAVLETFDGPTLQHAIKEMNGERLRRLPRTRAEQPDRDLLAERFEVFARAS